MTKEQIPELLEIAVKEILKTPAHIVNAESFLIEAKTLSGRFGDVQLQTINTTELRLINIAKDVKFFKESGLHGYYLHAVEEDQRLEIASCWETSILVTGKARVSYRLNDLQKSLDSLAESIGKHTRNPEQIMFSQGFHILRSTYTFS